MKKQINSEVKISNPDFKIKWGTMDKKNPSIIYLDLGTYISPRVDGDDYKKNMSRISKRVRETINSFIVATQDISNDFIFITDVAEDRFEYQKKSYLSFQIHFKIKKCGQIKFYDIVNYNNLRFENTYNVYNEIKGIIEDNGFYCSKRK